MIIEIGLTMERTSWVAPTDLPAETETVVAGLERNHQNAATEWFVGNQLPPIIPPPGH